MLALAEPVLSPAVEGRFVAFHLMVTDDRAVHEQVLTTGLPRLTALSSGDTAVLRCRTRASDKRRRNPHSGSAVPHSWTTAAAAGPVWRPALRGSSKEYVMTPPNATRLPKCSSSLHTPDCWDICPTASTSGRPS